VTTTDLTAALAVAARTSDAARAALLDYLAESDDPELRDRAELVRLEGDIRRLEFENGCSENAPSGIAGGIRAGCTACKAKARLTALQSRLSAWPCPECASEGWGSGSNLSRDVVCPACGGTGDVLKWNYDIGSPGQQQYPLTWDCGYPRWVTLPTMADAVQEDQLSRDTRIRLSMEDLPPSGFAPTPRLRALAATTPWGVPLEGVRVGDRRPADRVSINGSWYWFEDGRNALGDWYDESHIPRVLFDLLPGAASDTIGLPFPTESAAVDALARAVITFARECP
jgi:hypothetical protein